MMTITGITNIDNKKYIALLDTSSISFMQGLEAKGIPSDDILKDYDLILIPEWVLVEINDVEGRSLDIRYIVLQKKIIRILQIMRKVIFIRLFLLQHIRLEELKAICVDLWKRQMYLTWMHIKIGLISFMTSGRFQVRCYLRAE